QLQGVALEGAGVAAPRVGEGDLDLADGAAGQAADALHGQDDSHGPAADGHGAEAALDLAPADDLGRAAGGAGAVLGARGNGEGHAAPGVLSADVVIAADGEGVVQ